MTHDTIKHTCECGHDRDTHYKDPNDGRRYSCLGMRCDCRLYDEGHELKTPILPPNNFGKVKTASDGGRPHISCDCLTCLEWEYDRMRDQLPW